MAKKIDLAPDLKFSSILHGKTYFQNILNSTELNRHVSEGEFESLRLLYQAYCAKTNWRIKSPPRAFYPRLEQGHGFTTKCFGIEFEDGTKDRFSLDKALSAVAD